MTVERLPYPVSTLLVDDHRVFGEVLAAELRRDEDVVRVTVATSLTAGRVALRSQIPDIVLLDLDLADESGLDLIDDALQLDPAPKVLMLSASSSTDAIVSAIERGASGWVVKDAPIGELRTAISAVLRDRMYLPPERLKAVLEGFLEGRPADAAPEPELPLTPRQLEILSRLVAGQTRTEIARDLVVTVNTVRTHVQNMMRELRVHSTAALVAAALEAGVEPVGTTDFTQ